MSASITDNPISDAQLLRYATLIYDQTGIRISSQKKTLLSTRLRRRMKATGMNCYDAYLNQLQKLPANDPEWNAFWQDVTTHETYLFRDLSQWDWLRETWLADVQAEAGRGERDRKLSIWSAACSTGDEAYTIAACLADRIVNVSSWQINILGTDIAVGALQAARRARFNERAMRHVPPNYRKRFFTEVEQGRTWQPKAQLLSWATFAQHNLLKPMLRGPFDLIVLKNVLIYFDAASKAPVAQHVCNALRPGGYLITGPAENVAGMFKDLQRVKRWLHRKPDM